MTDLKGIEKFWYYLACICSFGGLYFCKIAAKKALIEMEQARVLAQHHQQHL